MAQADVTITKALVTTDPVAGQPLEYRLTLLNNGPTVAPNASLSDAIPTGTTFMSITPSQGTCQLDQAEDARAPPAASAPRRRRHRDGHLDRRHRPRRDDRHQRRLRRSGGLDDKAGDNEDTVTTALRHSPTWQ